MKHHEAEKYTRPLIGQAPWAVWLGVGSFISLEFGSQRPGRKRVHGEWNLWIQHAAWRIESSVTTVIASGDEREKISKNIQILEGKNILSIDILYPSLEVAIGFHQELFLRIFPVTTEDTTHWELFTPDNNVVVAGPGANWAYQSVNEP